MIKKVVSLFLMVLFASAPAWAAVDLRDLRVDESAKSTELMGVAPPTGSQSTMEPSPKSSISTSAQSSPGLLNFDSIYGSRGTDHLVENADRSDYAR